MKRTLIISLILASFLFPACDGGKADEAEKAVEAPAAQRAEDVAPSADQGNLTDLYMKLSKVGFDTPTETLPSIDFELPNLQGINEKLSDYKGQVVFLNFWATWCGPCRSEMPAMEQVYKELKGDGFVILAVDLAEDKKTVQKFVDELGLTFPVLLDETGSVGGMYDARSIPTTYLIGRDGNILGRAIGVRPWEEEEYMSLFKEILDL